MNDAAVTANTLRRHGADASAVNVPASAVESLELDLDVGVRLHVDAVDEPDPVRVVLHDHRAGARAIAEEPDTAHQRAVGDTGRREDDVVARRQILRAVDLLEVADPHRAAALL